MVAHRRSLRRRTREPASCFGSDARTTGRSSEVVEHALEFVNREVLKADRSRSPARGWLWRPCTMQTLPAVACLRVCLTSLLAATLAQAQPPDGLVWG